MSSYLFTSESVSEGHPDKVADQVYAGFEPLRPEDIAERLLDRETRYVRVRSMKRKQIRQELEILRDIFNDAWSENWGFVPFTEAEFNEVGKAMTLLLDHDFVQIAEVDGEAAAMILALPNVNEAIRDLHGRLLPFGWAKLLWRLKVRYPRSGRVPLMGVRKKYQHSRLGPALAPTPAHIAGHGVRERRQAFRICNLQKRHHRDAYHCYQDYDRLHHISEHHAVES